MNETYEDILDTMQEKFKALAGYSADEASDIGIRLRVLAGELFAINSNISWLNMQMFPQTAVNEQLDYHAEQRGISRKTAVKAVGELTFSVDTALEYDVTIPAGTVCATATDDSIRYETTETVILEAGEEEVSAEAKAQVGGEEGNCLEELVTVMVTPPSGISSVTNEVAFTGGTDSETDEDLRERILDSYANISNGTNSAFYKQEVMKNENVTSVSVVPLARGNGTVNIYVWSTSGSPSANLLAEIKAYLSQLREINVDIEVLAPTQENCNVSIELAYESGYEFATLKTQVENVIRSYVNSRQIGEKLYISRVGEKVLEVPGVKSYRPISCTDVSIATTKIARAGTITISEGV